MQSHTGVFTQHGEPALVQYKLLYAWNTWPDSLSNTLIYLTVLASCNHIAKSTFQHGMLTLTFLEHVAMLEPHDPILSPVLSDAFQRTPELQLHLVIYTQQSMHTYAWKHAHPTLPPSLPSRFSKSSHTRPSSISLTSAFNFLIRCLLITPSIMLASGFKRIWNWREWNC